MTPTLRRMPRINDLRLPSYSAIPFAGEFSFSEYIRVPPPSYSDSPTNMTTHYCPQGYPLQTSTQTYENRVSMPLSPLDSIDLNDFTFEVQPRTIPEDPTLRMALSQPHSGTQTPARSLTPLSTPPSSIQTSNSPLLPTFREFVDGCTPTYTNDSPSIPSAPSLPFHFDVTPPCHTFELASGFL